MHLNRDTAGFFIFGDVMSTPNPLLGRDLGAAICKHFGLDKAAVMSDFQIATKPGALASVTLTVALTADDLAGIARAAECSAQRSEPEHESNTFGRTSGVIACQLQAEQDHRWDEIIDLLRRILGRMDAPIPTVNVVPGE
jgi:hypothetical protein